MKRLFRTKMLPFLLTLSLVTNGITPGLVQPNTVYAAEASSPATSLGRTGAASIVLENGGIEIDGLSYTDAEFKTLLDSAEIIRIPFDAEVGEGMVEQAVASELVIDEGALAALGVAIGSVFITLAVILSLATLADKAYRVITKDGHVYDFRFLNDELFINNTLIKAFTSTIAVITSFFDDHLTANPDEEITDPDAGTGNVDKPGEGTEGDSDAGAENDYYKKGMPEEVPDDWIPFEDEEAPVKSDQFKKFLEDNGYNPKNWKKVMEKYFNPNDGEYYQRHYWTNGTDAYYHSDGLEIWIPH